MNTISIPVNCAYDAIIWAGQQFGKSNFRVCSTFPGNRYEFTFNQSDHAEFFALRWMQ